MNNILSQYKEEVAHNQTALDKIKADNHADSYVNRRKLVCGIGVNDANYATNPVVNGKKEMCYIYNVWKDMLRRCYSVKSIEKQPTYKGCTVCDEWHSFMSFKSWMENQDYEGKQLDKDLLIIGNKEYSPEACMFVSRHVNNLLTDHGAKRGKYPQGVTANREKYQVTLNIERKKFYIGVYDTVTQAESAYVKAKTSEIIRVALQQTSKKIMKSLINHASYMRINFECKQRLLANG